MIEVDDNALALRMYELAIQSDPHISVTQEQIDHIVKMFDDLAAVTFELVEKALSIWKEIIPIFLDFQEQRKALLWSKNCYPRLYHHATYSNRYRIRMKYIKRIVGLYNEEVNT